MSPVLAVLGQAHRYHRQVFLAPPWSEIYPLDTERRHGFDAAVAEYRRLLDVYPSLGYEVTILPKIGVAERAEFVLDGLAPASPSHLPHKCHKVAGRLRRSLLRKLWQRF